MKTRKTELLLLLLAVSLIAGTVGAQDITTGLVGYWKLDDGGGVTAVDSSANGYNGTLNNMDDSDWVIGKFGSGLEFDGTDDHILVQDDGTQLEFSTESFSIAFWMKTDVDDEPFGLISNGSWGGTYDAGAGKRYMFRYWPGSFRFEIDDDVTSLRLRIYNVDDFINGEWVHVVAIRDRAQQEIRVYLNGELQGTLAGDCDDISSPGENLYFGMEVLGTVPFPGMLDDIRFYNRVLSEDDMQVLLSLYEARNVSPKDGAVNVPVESNFEWLPPPTFTPTGYDLYYKIDDPNFEIGATVVSGIPHTDPCVVHNPDVNFAYNTTYYWQVDSYASCNPSDPCQGSVWSFTTAPAEPVVIKDPVPLTVAIGGTAVFTVEDVGGTGYVWKKQSTGLTVGTGSVLTLTDVQKDPCEDSYYCIVSNASGSVESAAAGLWTKRLIALYEFEDNLDDSEADDWNGDYIDPNTDNDPPTPVFASGLEGQALQLTADELHVQITGSEDYFNFYPLGYSANVWIKTVQSDWGCMASKQDKIIPYPHSGWTLDCGNGDIWNGLREVGSISSDVNINDNQWHMVTATYDAEAGVITTYVDGEPVGSDASTDVASTNAYPVVLGAEFTDGQVAYEGLLDSVGIYSYGLSPLEVAVLYTDVMTDAEICIEQPENDLSGDCRVDLEDFAILATNWLECNLVPDCIP